MAVARSSQATLGQITIDLEALATRVGRCYQDAISPIVYELLASRLEFETNSSRACSARSTTCDLPETGQFTPWRDFFDPELVNILMGGGAHGAASRRRHGHRTGVGVSSRSDSRR